MLTAEPRFDAVVLGSGDAATRAVEAAGGRVSASFGWDRAVSLGDVAGRPVVLVEATGADAATLATALPLVAAVAEERELPVVVALDDAQIDAVAADLLGARVHLLCLPAMSDRIGALVLAARELAPEAFALVGETERQRVARLSVELARIADLLVRLTAREERAGSSPDAIADRTSGYEGPPVEVDAAPVDPAEIRRVIRARRVRDRAFTARLFEDPAWDILLDLFAASLERAEVSASSLCIAAAVAPTTALRWIGRMTASGLLVRERDPFDQRRALISLSPTALAGMRSYVAMLRAQGLPLV